jgi:hypothetical protein
LSLTISTQLADLVYPTAPNYSIGLEFTVYDAVTRQPIPGVEVTVTARSELYGTFTYKLVTDANGWVRFVPLPATATLDSISYSVSASHPNYKSSSLVYSPPTEVHELIVYSGKEPSRYTMWLTPLPMPAYTLAMDVTPRTVVAGDKLLFTGRLLEDGVPVPNAEIELWAWYPPPSPQEWLWLGINFYTDENGEFREYVGTTGLSPGVYKYKARYFY